MTKYFSENQEKIVKRFIAGATCPKCQAVDKLRAFRIEDRYFQDCVACDFEDEIGLLDEPDVKPVGLIGSDRG